jgi:hypothetical protein
MAMAYNPNEPRTSDGRWASNGGEHSRSVVKAHDNTPSVGFSVDQSGKSPKSGFMVSYPKLEKKFTGNSATAKQEVAYMRQNHAALNLPGNYFGGWPDKGKMYLDVSRDIPKRADA